MRRVVRHLAVLVLTALLAAGCANASPEELALIEAAQADLGVIDPGTPTGDGAVDDFAVDAPAEPETPIPADAPDGPASRLGTRPEVKRFRCPFDEDATTDADCGRIELPGRGVDPDFTIELSFVRFNATGDAGETHADPLVYLHGGPGVAVLDVADYYYADIVEPHIEHRDVILYDQRGSGQSTPLPICHETSLSVLPFYTTEESHDALGDAFLEAVVACANRLRNNDDIDVTAFSSATNAQDLVDLMWALGVEEYNVHGSSYGTRLAQTVLRDAPGGVRSVVLSGTYPIDVNLMGSIPTSLESSLDAVFDGCAQSQVCAEALPDPWATLESLVSHLDADPIPVEIATDATNTLTSRFDGTDLIAVLHGLLYTSYHAATVPDMLIDWVDGDYRRLERMARTGIRHHADIAVFALVECADEGPFTTPENLDRPIEHEFLNAAALPPSLTGVDAIAVCDAWGSGLADPIENEPVVWNVPTLILAGSADPITPPEWAHAMAQRLPRARLVESAGLSHDSDNGWCATTMIAEFVSRPDLLIDTSCAATATHLVVDELAERFRGPLEFADQTEDLDGDGEFVDYVVPAWTSDWREEGIVYWRALDQLDRTALAVLEPDAMFNPQELLPAGIWFAEWEAPTVAAVPGGWDRDELTTAGGRLIRYIHITSGVTLVLSIEPGEPDDLERVVLIPVARSIGGKA